MGGFAVSIGKQVGRIEVGKGYFWHTDLVESVPPFLDSERREEDVFFPGNV